MSRRVADERGFSLVEVLVAMLIGLLVLGVTLTAFEALWRQDRLADRQQDASQQARVTLDRLARQLRNLASPTVLTSVAGTQPRSVELNDPYDLVFKDVDGTMPAGSLNTANVRRVRYCLQHDDPARGRLYQQTQTWITATAPAMPADTACPGSGWTTTQLVSDNVTNADGDRGVFSYSGDAGPITGTDLDSRAKVSRIAARLWIDPDPGKAPAETSLETSVFLRNQNREPIADFDYTVVQPSTHTVRFNGSFSQDPESQALNYAWYIDDADPLLGIVVQTPLSVGTHTVKLVVSDPAGLTGTKTETLEILP